MDDTTPATLAEQIDANIKASVEKQEMLRKGVISPVDLNDEASKNDETAIASREAAAVRSERVGPGLADRVDFLGRAVAELQAAHDAWTARFEQMHTRLTDLHEKLDARLGDTASSDDAVKEV